MRRRLFERGEPEHPLTGYKIRLLECIADLEIAIPAQLSARTGMSGQAVRKHLRDLFDLGLVERMGVHRSALADPEENDTSLLYGRAPTIYTLSKEGGRVLGVAVKTPSYGPRNAVLLAHELGARDFRVWLELVAKDYGHPGIVSWLMGSEAIVGRARPDARFVYQFKGVRLLGLLEIDRGTETLTRWKEKFSQYAPLLTPGSTALKEATGESRGRVLVVTPNEKRRAGIADVIWSCLDKARIEPERYWITVRSSLGNRDLAAPVWQVPELEGLQPLVPEQLLA